MIAAGAPRPSSWRPGWSVICIRGKPDEPGLEAATLGTHEPLRGQLRIALSSGVTKDEIVELFIHLEAYAGAARAFDSYQIALAVFAEHTSD